MCPSSKHFGSVTSVPRETAETPNYGVSSLKAARTLKILIKIIKNLKSWDGRATMVRCSGLERSRRGKMCYSNIRTPVHRDAIPKVLGLLYAKFWVQTLGIATLWTGVSVFCNLHTAFPLNFPVCVPRPRSGFYWHRSRFSSWSPEDGSLWFCNRFPFFMFVFYSSRSNTLSNSLFVSDHCKSRTTTYNTLQGCFR